MIPKHFEGIVTEFRQTADAKVKGPLPWAGIIIHHTGLNGRIPSLIDAPMWKQMFANITDWLAKGDENYLSAHFHIGRYGECAMLANPDSQITFHAGESTFFHPSERKHLKSWNAYAIGIEVLGDGNLGEYSDQQYRKIAKLCAALMKRYRMIDPRCITGHENLTGRKNDPGKYFNWRLQFKMIFEELAILEIA